MTELLPQLLPELSIELLPELLPQQGIHHGKSTKSNNKAAITRKSSLSAAAGFG